MSEFSPLVPQSEATNMFDLLNDIKRAINAEPKRLDMSNFRRRGSALLDVLYEWNKHRGQEKSGTKRALTVREAPSCGLVGCIAGWQVTLKRLITYDDNNGVYFVAQQQMGIKLDPFGRPLPEDKEFYDEVYNLYHTFPSGTPGTFRYVRKVIASITAFQKQHKARLLATPV